MRNTLLTASALVLCAAATAGAAPTTVLEANVPFSFVVNGQQLPAGKYMVQRDGASVLLIRGEKNHAAMYVATTPDGGTDPAGSKPALQFKRYENQYRLTSVWESQGEGWDVAGR